MTAELKFTEAGEVKEFTIPRPTLYVAVYRYDNNDQLFGTCMSDKQVLMAQVMTMTYIDKSFPVRIYTITI